MDMRGRADKFAEYVGLALKGAITEHGFAASAVADRLGRSRSAFTNWLNTRKATLPLEVLAEACEVIGVEPSEVVKSAYERLCREHGPARPDRASLSNVVRTLEDQREKRMKLDIDVAADKEELRLGDQFGDGEAGDEVDGEPGD